MVCPLKFFHDEHLVYRVMTIFRMSWLILAMLKYLSIEHVVAGKVIIIEIASHELRGKILYDSKTYQINQNQNNQHFGFSTFYTILAILHKDYQCEKIGTKDVNYCFS